MNVNSATKPNKKPNKEERNKRNAETVTGIFLRRGNAHPSIGSI